MNTIHGRRPAQSSTVLVQAWAVLVPALPFVMLAPVTCWLFAEPDRLFSALGWVIRLLFRALGWALMSIGQLAAGPGTVLLLLGVAALIWRLTGGRAIHMSRIQ